MELYNMCSTFHVLPKSGGVLDQPARLVYLLNQVQVAVNEREVLEQKRSAAEAKAKMPRSGRG